MRRSTQRSGPAAALYPVEQRDSNFRSNHHICIFHTLIRESREDRYIPQATIERNSVRPRATLRVANRMNFSYGKTIRLKVSN